MWHPMASMEQSMMDLEEMANQMMSSRFPFEENMLAAPSNTEDDDFFKDLPVKARGETPETQQEPSKKEGERAFSTYSFSNSSVVDDQGKRVTSTRRRYEDSTGRLKAVHERQMGSRTLRTVWNRMHKNDKGQHEMICSQGSPEEFEKMWKNTPFGKAQDKKLKAQEEEEGQKKIQA
jgi:hypothetical protein